MPRLHPLFTDHAVISARRPCVLGTANPGTVVTVNLAGRSTLATASLEGRWSAEFPPLPHGGPHTLLASDASGTTMATDVLLGEVWLGSGQSNMEWSLEATKDTAADIANAQEPLLRLFTVVKRTETSGPLHTLEGRWQLCTPREAFSFSAIGYFFGRRMAAQTGLPFGVIISAWGGSALAPWLPEETLHQRPEYRSFLSELAQARDTQTPPEACKQYEDPGIASHAQGWADPSTPDQDWGSLRVPGQWQDEGWAFNGAVWYRRTIEIPAAWLGNDLELCLGIVDDCDHSYVNGTLVGSMGVETPNWWATPRFHKVPASLITGTTVHLAVRVFDLWGNGGILGNARLQLLNDPSQPAVPLVGKWRAKAELELPLRSAGIPPTAPTSLWNAMIHPLLGCGLNGFLWYQGESDVGRARLYQRLLTDLINTWRNAFKAPEIPFGIVQLANYTERKSTPSEDIWAELREAQRRVAATVTNCGLAVAIDAGEADDIHPRYKRIVSERLADWALHQQHGRTELPQSGPLPAEWWSESDGLRIRFVHAEGLRMRGDALRGFQLAGFDRRWVWAEASLAGDTVLVRSPLVQEPLAVRYAWQSNPETTLENTYGLPASPFRTDDW